MGAIIEWVTGVLRAGPSTNVHGDPFEFSATIIKRGDTVEVVGASGTMPKGLLRQLKTLLAEEGVTKITWDRKKAHGERHIETGTE